MAKVDGMGVEYTVRELRTSAELHEALRLTAAAFKDEVAGAGLTCAQWIDFEYTKLLEEESSWRTIGELRVVPTLALTTSLL